jgi:drug/metabolite transporter (DMT)-like permease
MEPMTDRRLHLDGLAVTTLVICCALWGLNQVATKIALSEVPPLLQAGVRSIAAAVLVLAWCKWLGIKLFERDGTLPGGLLAGALFGLEFACIFAGLQFTTASRMVVFINLSPFVVALGMPFIAKVERLRTTQLVGLALAFAAVAWAFAESFTSGHAPPKQWLGDGLGVVAAVLWGSTTLSIRATKLSGASGEKTLFYQLCVSGVALLLGAWLIGEPLPKTISLQVSSMMAFQIVVVTFASYLLWFRLIRQYPATKLASFTLLTPLFGLLAGALLLGEPVTTRLVVALLAVSAGIMLVNRR